MSSQLLTLVLVPLIAFIVVVLPLWIVLYYRDRNRQSHALSADEWKEIMRMIETTERLETRLAALEAILDSDHKGWRNPS